MTTTLTKRQSRMLGKAADRSIVLMSADEARGLVIGYRNCIEHAAANVTSARAIVLDLYNREGWRALGYDTWRACAMAELGLGQTHVYRLLTAAEVERDIRLVLDDFSPDGKSLSTAALEPIAQLESVEDRQLAAQQAIEAAGGNVPTARQVRSAVEQIKRPVCGSCELQVDQVTIYDAGIVPGHEGYAVQLCAECTTLLMRAADRLCECGQVAIDHKTIGGLKMWRCPSCQADALAVEQVDLAEAGYTVQPNADLAELCDQAESLGATINYTALASADRVRVVPPAGYQKTPLDCDAKDLAMLVKAWTKNNDHYDAGEKTIADRAGLLRLWRAVETALDAHDRAGALASARSIVTMLGG